MKFEFANPWYLLLALVVPPLIAWWLCQGRNALRHSRRSRLPVHGRSERGWPASAEPDCVPSV